MHQFNKKLSQACTEFAKKMAAVSSNIRNISDEEATDIFLEAVVHATTAELDLLNQMLKQMGCIAEHYDDAGTTKARLVLYIDPEFKTAMEEHKRVLNEFGPQSREAMRAWCNVMDLAPQSFLDLCEQSAIELGLLPDPSCCDEHGNKLYSMSSIAEKAGTTEDEMNKFVSQNGLSDRFSPVSETYTLH